MSPAMAVHLPPSSPLRRGGSHVLPVKTPVALRRCGGRRFGSPRSGWSPDGASFAVPEGYTAARRAYAMCMTGSTRWMIALDMDRDDYAVRIRDLLWVGWATLRDERTGELLSELVWDNRADALEWLDKCEDAWDRGLVPAPPREAAVCTICTARTGRPIVVDPGFAVSATGSFTRSVCPPCAAKHISVTDLNKLRREHSAICPKCRLFRFCEMRRRLTDTYDAALGFERARHLGY